MLLLVAAETVLAQVTFDRAEFNREAKLVTVNSTSDAAAFHAVLPQLGDMANWAIYYRGSKYRVESVQVNEAQRVIRLEYDTQSLVTPNPEDLSMGDLSLEFRPPGVQPVLIQNQSRKASVSGLKFTGSKKSADIDISGGIQAGVNAKPEYFWSVKAAYPFVLKPGFGHIDPTFEGEASQQKNADPDSMKASLVYNNRWPVSGRTGFALRADLLGYEFERAIKNEAVLVDGKAVKRNFLEKDSNLMWSGSARWVHGWKTLNYGVGFAGFEVGKAVTRTVKKDSRNQEITNIARPKFDLDVYRDFFKGQGTDAKRIVTFDGHYTLRLPLTAEPFQRAGLNNDDPFLTRKPRHWLNLNVGLLLRDGVGLTVQYKYGSLPPSFEFVDHQITVGFNLLLKKK